MSDALKPRPPAQASRSELLSTDARLGGTDWRDERGEPTLVTHAVLVGAAVMAIERGTSTMWKARKRLAVFSGVFVLLCLGSCDSPTMVDDGTWYSTGWEWPHDGNPYESEHFIVFSDAASLSARRTLAGIAEELRAALRDEFGIAHDSLFAFPPGQSKIHIFAYKDQYRSEWGGQAYLGGFMIWSLDHPRRNTEINNYTAVAKHELMHVVEYLLRGSRDYSVDWWLSEGLAEYVAGGTAGGSVTRLAKLDSLVATYGELNPIAMHRYQASNVELMHYYYHYPMFELAVAYLLDPMGAGRAKSEVTDLFLDIRSGVVFSTAFENRLGISLTGYEDRFFDLIRGFLQ